MKSLNILELHRTINAKKSLQKEVYENILSKCHRRIELMTSHCKLKCFFDIPTYVIGYPLYDLNKCIEFVMESLTKNGFIVKYYFPTYIYISWDLNEISKPEPKIEIPRLNTTTTYKPLLSSSIQIKPKDKRSTRASPEKLILNL
jgi:hypothetical protein